MSIYLESVEDLLIEWGRAARAGTVRTYYKPGFLGRIKGSTVKSAGIEPDDFEQIDAIVSKLKLIDEKLHETAGYIFIQNRTYDETARALKTSKRTVSQYKQSIIAFVAGSMNDI
jgi:hypothetical protein